MSWRQLCGAAVLTAAVLTPAASQATVLPVALVSPAHITPRAQHGLFTAIANVGKRLVAVGEQGRILLSDDNGASWRQVPAPTSVTLTGVTFATPQDGWAIGQMGVILRTQDGGESWTRVFDGSRANSLLQNAAEADLKAQPSSQIAQANLTTAKEFISGGVTVPFLGIRALSARTVLAVGGFGMAFESQDGGANWQPIFDAIPNPNGFNIYGVLPAAGQLYFLGEQGFLASRAADGRFRPLTTPATGTFFGGLAAPDGSLILYGLQGGVFRSADQGAYWASIPTGVSAGIDAGLTLRNGTMVLGDTSGDLLVSTDSGQHFTLAAQAGEPVAALAQAADGELIVAGPQGLKSIALARLASGVHES